MVYFCVSVYLQFASTSLAKNATKNVYKNSRSGLEKLRHIINIINFEVVFFEWSGSKSKLRICKAELAYIGKTCDLRVKGSTQSKSRSPRQR